MRQERVDYDHKSQQDCFMKILDQNIQLSSQHYAADESQQQRVHETFINGQLATRESTTLSNKIENYSTALSQNAKPDTLKALIPLTHNQDVRVENTSSEVNPQSSMISTGANTSSLEEQVNLPPKLIKMIEAIEAMMERFTGKPYEMKVLGYESENKAFSNGALSPPNYSNHNANQTALQSSSANVAMPEVQTPSTGERWSYSERYQEEELSSFKAQGHVTTENGQQIQFDLNAQMHRRFETHLHVEKTKGVVFTDPLVVNFGGSPATLAIEKIQFDIDADGIQDSISFLNQGSGFLALDSNQDGVINNGLELFGTQSGDGFADLSQFDYDQNGWIDENDAIFSQLQIWHKDANGFNQLQGLLELNIGAINLQNIDTPFALKDNTNQQHGQVVSSGVFLHETGEAGTIQQIDLVV